MREKDVQRFFENNYPDIVNSAATVFLDQRQGNQQNPTVVPSVIIGLGGSGVKSVARLKWRLKNYYKSAALQKENDRERGVELNRFMKRLAFLAIDTVSYDKILQEDPEGGRYIQRELSRNDEYIEVGGFNPGDYIKNQYGSSPDLQQWWDTSYHPPHKMIDDGAKRVRSLGRLALYQSREKIRAAVSRAVGDVNAIYNQEVQRGQVNAGNNVRKIEIYIFSGTCGGTGSGMVLDLVNMCHDAVKTLGIQPTINMVLTMPGIYIQSQYTKQGGEMLAKAFQANSYAFFKELSHMLADANYFHGQTMDAIERNNDDLAPNTGWQPDRIYLVDTEIAGEEIAPRDMGHMFMMGADYVCQKIIASGGNLAFVETNVDDQLLKEVGGQKSAFSSFGISYIMYPSKTISRCLSSMLLRDAFSHAVRPVQRDDRELVEKLRVELVNRMGPWLDPAKIDQRLMTGTENYYGDALPDKNKILQDHAAERSASYAAELDKLQAEGEAMEKKGRQKVEQNYQTFLDEAEEKVFKPLVTASVELLKQGICHAQAVLQGVHEVVLSNSHAKFPPPQDRPEQEAREAVDRIKKLEKGFFSMFRKGAIEREIEEVVSKVKEETQYSIHGRAADLRAGYLENLAARVKQLTEHLKRVQYAMDFIVDNLDEAARNVAPDFEEMTVGATTQYVPEPVTPEGMVTIYQQCGAGPMEFFQELAANKNFMQGVWAAGAEDDGRALAGLNELISAAVESAMAGVGAPHLKQTVTGAIKKKWGKEPGVFREQNGRQLLKQVDPTWALDEQRIPQGQNVLTQQLVGTAMYPDPDFEPAQYFPADLVRNTPTPGDPRMFMALSSRHGAPLFAVRNLVSYRNAYNQHMDATKRGSAGSPHISRQWDTAETLPDLDREVQTAGETVALFTYGLFIDWLAKEKNVLALAECFEGGEVCGPITERKGEYVMVKHEINTATHKFRETGALPLGTRRRFEATHKLPGNGRETIEAFKKQVDALLPPSQQLALLTEYQGVLTARYDAEVNLSALLALPLGERESYITRELTDDLKRKLARHMLLEIDQIASFRRELGTH